MTQLTTAAFAGVLFPEVVDRLTINISADETPIYSTLLAMGRKVTVGSPTLEWWTVDADARQTLINDVAGYDNDDTDLTLDSTAHLRVGDVLCVARTGELMLITAINAAVVTVVRGVGTTAGAAIVDNDPIINLGPFFMEGDTLPAARNTTNVKKTSYTQIFKRALDLSRTADKSTLKGEAARTEERRKKLIEINRDIEHAAIFGEPFEETSGGKIRRGTMGVRSFAGVNIADANGTLTEPELDDWLSQVFAKGSRHRLVTGGRTACDVVRRIKKPTMQGRPEDSVIGFKATRYQTPDGEFDLKTHRLMTGAADTELIAIDLEGGADGVVPEICVLNGSDVMLKENQQPPGQDGVSDQYLGELGFRWGNPETHGRLTNVSASG